MDEFKGAIRFEPMLRLSTFIPDRLSKRN